MRKLNLLIATLSILGILSSCGNPTPNTSVNNNSNNVSTDSTNDNSSNDIVDLKTLEFDTTKDVYIKFYTTMGHSLQTVFNTYLEQDFAELYPNIHVTSEFIGSYDDVRDQMSTELASGKTDVNVAYCYPDHIATYNSAKSVISLDDLIERDDIGFSVSEYKDFIKAYYDEGKSFGDGKMYCLPFSKSSEVMYYNKTFFEANNLKVPTHWFQAAPNDDTSMEYVCKKIKEIDSNSIPLGYDSASNLFITMCAQLDTPYTAATGEHYLFDNAKNQEFIETFKTWYQSGLITTKDLYGQYTSGLFTETKPDAAKCYMCIGSSAGASYQVPSNETFEAGIAPIPQANENNKKVIQQGPDVCIFDNKDPQKILASWLFVKFFTTYVPFQAEFSMTSGYTPVIRSVFENEVYKDFLAKGEAGDQKFIQALSTKVCVEQEANYFTSPAFVGSSNARTQVGNLVNQALSGKVDVNTAFKNAISKCKE